MQKKIVFLLAFIFVLALSLFFIQKNVGVKQIFAQYYDQDSCPVGTAGRDPTSGDYCYGTYYYVHACSNGTTVTGTCPSGDICSGGGSYGSNQPGQCIPAESTGGGGGGSRDSCANLPYSSCISQYSCYWNGSTCYTVNNLSYGQNCWNDGNCTGGFQCLDAGNGTKECLTQSNGTGGAGSCGIYSSKSQCDSLCGAQTGGSSCNSTCTACQCPSGEENVNGVCQTISGGGNACDQYGGQTACNAYCASGYQCDSTCTQCVSSGGSTGETTLTLQVLSNPSTLTVGTSSTIQFFVYDQNNNVVTTQSTVAENGNIPGMTYNQANANFTGTPTTAGSYQIVVTAYSKTNTTINVTKTFTIPIQNGASGSITSLRVQPQFTGIIQFQVGTQASLQFFVFDQNNNVVTSQTTTTANITIPGMTFNQSSALLSGTPTAGGDYPITVTAILNSNHAITGSGFATIHVSGTGQTSSGQTSSGQSTAGQTSTGQTNTGQTVSGQTNSGQTVSGQTNTGQTVSGQTSSGNTSSGQISATPTPTVSIGPTPTGVPAGSYLYGWVYNDQDKSGSFDQSKEQGVPGAVITVSTNEKQLGQFQTNDQGFFTTSTIPQGQYIVQLTVPAGYSVTSQNPVVINLGGNAQLVNFGIFNSSITITPSPTCAAGSPTTFIPLVTVPGIGKNTGDNANPVHPQREAHMILIPVDNFGKPVQGAQPLYVDGTLAFNGTSFTGKMTTPCGIQSGSYNIYIRMDNTLVRQITRKAITVTAGQTNDLSGDLTELVPGDLNGDNFIDLTDYNILIGCFGNKLCSRKDLSDLNDDGKIDETDINVFLRGIATEVENN